MKVRFTFLLAVAACVSGSTEKDVEEEGTLFCPACGASWQASSRCEWTPRISYSP
jgi:predicted RNA-binding Zn-ribbon protein involved in translation (DUF1610 family)